MTETLSFPGLGPDGLEFELRRVAFRLPEFLGSLAINWYGIIIAAAFLAGMAYLLKRVTDFGLDADRVLDVILGSTLCGIVGARLYYVIFSWDTYRDNLVSIFNIRLGGLAIYGGIIGAFAGGYFLCKWRRVKLLPMLDLAVGSLILGQAIGRWGNFVNIEAFGSNTSAPWGMTSPTIVRYLQEHRADLAAIGVTVDPSQPVHPTFFYESLWCLLGFLFLAWFTKRRRFDGQLTLIYFLWYGAGRFLIEGLRTDSLLIGTLRVSQMLALLCVLAAGIALLAILSRIRREGDPEYLQLYVETEEAHQILAGNYYQQFDKKKKSQDKDSKSSDEESPDDSVSEEEAESEESDNTPSDEPEKEAEECESHETDSDSTEAEEEDHGDDH